MDAPGGASVGAPSRGWLVHGTRLPERGAGFAVLRTPRDGGQHWGTSRLVDLVRRVARTVLRRHPGSVLVVGDLSARHGGSLRHHHSHRSGRDVDLLFYAADAMDAPVPATAFVRFDPAGGSLATAVPLRFDVPRNWALVEALARDEQAGVVRIFVAAWLRRMLLEHGRRRGVASAVMDRAEQLLVQPGDSFAHDDHFHVRIACTPLERSHGCVDGAPIWHWLEKDWLKTDCAPADDDTLLAALDELPPGILHGPPPPPAEAAAGAEPRASESSWGVCELPRPSTRSVFDDDTPRGIASFLDAAATPEERGVCWR